MASSSSGAGAADFEPACNVQILRKRRGQPHLKALLGLRSRHELVSQQLPHMIMHEADILHSHHANFVYLLRYLDLEAQIIGS